MLALLRSHWRIITIVLALALLGTGVAYYFVHAAAQGNQEAFAAMKEELESTKAALDKSMQESSKNKAAYAKEKALNADLTKAMAVSDKEVASLRASLETMTQTAAKAEKIKVVKSSVQAPAAVPKCRKSEPDMGKEQLRALQDFQADLYRRESELREEARKLQEEKNKLADDRHKLNLDKSEYRWPRNAETGKDK